VLLKSFSWQHNNLVCYYHKSNDFHFTYKMLKNYSFWRSLQKLSISIKILGKRPSRKRTKEIGDDGTHLPFQIANYWLTDN
jgi:hypothetical protein